MKRSLYATQWAYQSGNGGVHFTSCGVGQQCPGGLGVALLGRSQVVGNRSEVLGGRLCGLAGNTEIVESI